MQAGQPWVIAILVAPVTGAPDAVAALAPAWYEPSSGGSVTPASHVERALLRWDTAALLAAVLAAALWIATT